MKKIIEHKLFKLLITAVMFFVCIFYWVGFKSSACWIEMCILVSSILYFCQLKKYVHKRDFLIQSMSLYTLVLIGIFSIKIINEIFFGGNKVFEFSVLLLGILIMSIVPLYYFFPNMENEFIHELSFVEKRGRLIKIIEWVVSASFVFCISLLIIKVWLHHDVWQDLNNFLINPPRDYEKIQWIINSVIFSSVSAVVVIIIIPVIAIPILSTIEIFSPEINQFIGREKKAIKLSKKIRNKIIGWIIFILMIIYNYLSFTIVGYPLRHIISIFMNSSIEIQLSMIAFIGSFIMFIFKILTGGNNDKH